MSFLFWNFFPTPCCGLLLVKRCIWFQGLCSRFYWKMAIGCLGWRVSVGVKNRCLDPGSTEDADGSVRFIRNVLTNNFPFGSSQVFMCELTCWSKHLFQSVAKDGIMHSSRATLINICYNTEMPCSPRLQVGLKFCSFFLAALLWR